MLGKNDVGIEVLVGDLGKKEEKKNTWMDLGYIEIVCENVIELPKGKH